MVASRSMHLRVVDEQHDEKALIERCCQGDRRAFDELYLLHVDFVHKCLVGLVGLRAPLDDLIQTVFLEAFRSLHHFKGDSAYRTWLYRVTANTAFQYLRKQKPEKRDDDALLLLPSTDPSPEQKVDEQEALSTALEYLDALKPKHRIAFVLRVVEDLSLKEIGAIVGATVPTVGARIRTAEKRLRTLVARDRGQDSVVERRPS
ncbi:MAG: hypothetical protein A2341_28735 [Deltaproteobacteria bacterium RIFOXYB12_FULL_58_9]|nr:MAG: hypothetical protein A2341_28735 [Deltaproteobacteria bacterium RIFOXYB12_FULL_58_9]